MKEFNSSIMRLNACVAKGYSHLKVGFVAALFAACLYPVNGYAQSVQKSGATYTPVASKDAPKVKAEHKWTGKYYTDPKSGDNYKIYIGKTGSCYLLKQSKKSGNEYRDYNMMYKGVKYGPIISKEICKELGIEYKPKSSK